MEVKERWRDRGEGEGREGEGERKRDVIKYTSQLVRANKN